MLKKTIKYEDLFTNEKVEEDFYFNLNKNELIEMQLSANGGLSRYIAVLEHEQDSQKLYQMMKEVVLKAYCVRDGSTIKKSKELAEQFAAGAAFDALIMEFFEEPDKAAEFIIGAMPREFAEEGQKAIAEQKKSLGL